jgi:hypothetical protein
VFIVLERSCVIVPGRRHADEEHGLLGEGHQHIEDGDPCVRGHQRCIVFLYRVIERSCSPLASEAS